MCGAAHREASALLSEVSVPKRVAIARASGYIGGRLAPRLMDEGYSIRCLVHSPGKLAGRSWAALLGDEIRQRDLENAASLEKNLAGCEAAFPLAHWMTSAGAEYVNRERCSSSALSRAVRVRVLFSNWPSSSPASYSGCCTGTRCCRCMILFSEAFCSASAGRLSRLQPLCRRRPSNPYVFEMKGLSG